MKTYFTSDLHWDSWQLMYSKPCEFLEDRLPRMEALVVAGDLANTYHDWCDIVGAMSRMYRTVILVLGNHDIACSFGDEKLFENTEHKIYDFRKFLKYYPNVHLLDGTVLKVGSHTIGGCMGMWDHTYADRHRIKHKVVRNYWKDWFDNLNWNYMHNDENAIRNSEFAKLNVCLSAKPQFMVTHFCPFPGTDNLLPAYRDDVCSTFFYFDAKYTVNVPTWIAGHTHEKIHTKLAGSELTVNPLGYCHEVCSGAKVDTSFIVDL